MGPLGTAPHCSSGLPWSRDAAHDGGIEVCGDGLVNQTAGARGEPSASISARRPAQPHRDWLRLHRRQQPRTRGAHFAKMGTLALGEALV